MLPVGFSALTTTRVFNSAMEWQVRTLLTTWYGRRPGIDSEFPRRVAPNTYFDFITEYNRFYHIRSEYQDVIGELKRLEGESPEARARRAKFVGETKLAADENNTVGAQHSELENELEYKGIVILLLVRHSLQGMGIGFERSAQAASRGNPPQKKKRVRFFEPFASGVY
jgi:hypothetical protein